MGRSNPLDESHPWFLWVESRYEGFRNTENYLLQEADKLANLYVDVNDIVNFDQPAADASPEQKQAYERDLQAALDIANAASDAYFATVGIYLDAVKEYNKTRDRAGPGVIPEYEVPYSFDTPDLTQRPPGKQLDDDVPLPPGVC